MQLQTLQTRVNTLVLKTADNGVVTGRLMTQKEYFDANQVKGADGKRKHKEYLRENGVLLTGEFDKVKVTHALIMQKARMNPKSGAWNVTYVPKSKLEVKASDTDKAAQAAAEEKVKAILEEKAQALAKQLNCDIAIARGYVGLN